MKIISYNVNGIRAAIRKGLINWIQEYNPDILCLQEIKAFTEQINTDVFYNMGYYNYWFPSKRPGYSGVGIISKIKPKNVIYGIGIPDIDIEGRIVRLDFDLFSIINVYIPSASNIVKRLNFKLKFLNYFFQYIQVVKKNYPNLIISGDYNICHNKIDIYNPINSYNLSGFLPIERKWITELIDSGFIDSFRFLFKSKILYSWWSYRYKSRIYNKGWRIDYHMVSTNLLNSITNAYIFTEVTHSDHCPILLKINLYCCKKNEKK